MDYVLIEFLGVFFLTFFKSLGNMTVINSDCEPVINAIITMFTLFIFCVLAKSVSKGMFNPVFAVTENLWNHMSVETSLGYITAHILASLLATSVLTMVVPFSTLSNPKLNVGVALINPESDNFSLLTMEIVGTFVVFFGHLYFNGKGRNDDPYVGCFFYAFVMGALQLSTYNFNGGAYNIGSIIGGLLFSASAEPRIVFLFFGNIAGAILAKLLYEQVLVQKNVIKQSRTIKKLLKK